jgi:hypothetical protein
MATTKKATSNMQKSKKGTVSTIHKIMATDIFKSVAIVSILLNLLFIITILVGGNHSSIYISKGNYRQRAARLEDAQAVFCKKEVTDQYIEEAAKNGKQENAKIVVAANCGTGEYGEQVRDLRDNLTNQ